jgi:hypothetical protein
MITKPPLQKILWGILHTESETKKIMKWQTIPNNSRRKGKKVESIIDSVTHHQTLKHLRQPNNRDHHIPSILPLNINGLKFPIKRHWLANWIKKKDPTSC